MHVNASTQTSRLKPLKLFFFAPILSSPPSLSNRVLSHSSAPLSPTPMSCPSRADYSFGRPLTPLRPIHYFACMRGQSFFAHLTTSSETRKSSCETRRSTKSHVFGSRSHLRRGLVGRQCDWSWRCLQELNNVAAHEEINEPSVG